MKKYTSLIILILFFISCKKDLKGHWHAEFINSPYETVFLGAIDIEKNNDTYFTSSLSYSPVKGVLNPKEKNIWVYYGECGSGNFDYHLKGNTLYLENYLGAKLKAKRVICNRICDYQTNLNLDFLKLKKLPNNSFVIEKTLSEYINIGFSKKDSSLMLETSVSDKLQTINSLDYILSKIKNYHSEEEVPYIDYILTPDKNIKANIFKNVLERLQKNGKKKIYIRTLKDSLPTDRNIFEYIRIRDGMFDFNSEKPLKEVIN